jgi:hypothetical protein
VSLRLIALALLAFLQLATCEEPLRELYIARHTFFDFGPPLDYYELLHLHISGGRTLVDRYQVTPYVSCYQPATVQVDRSGLDGSIEELLEGRNLCRIPEKELRREAKRCKKCLTFSGAFIVIEAQCDGRPRRIPVRVLDGDLFSESPHPPRQTSASMELLRRLDGAFASGVMDRPILQTGAPAPRPPTEDATIADLRQGRFDGLFDKAPDKISELVRQSELPGPPPPSVRLEDSTPVFPSVYEPLAYPPLAKIARIEGPVSFTASISSDGRPTNVQIVAGHPLLLESVKLMVAGWKYPEGDAGQEVQGTLDFKTNCPAAPH